MELTDEEKTIFRLQSRYEQVCKMLGWSTESRQIGRALLDAKDGEGSSERAIARETQIPRSTVKRKIGAMQQNMLIEKINDNVALTEMGKAFHVKAHREIWRVAAGQQVGLSKELIFVLSQLPDKSGLDLKALADVSFPADIPREFTVRIW